jgi:cytochrome oxidase Cu insertion factor (SCO1/SenC/PrrC family)
MVKSTVAIPAFSMNLTNGQKFSSGEIHKNKPFVLIYFAPDCDHCMILMDKLFKKIHQLDKASVVFITFKPVNELIAFEKKYNTARYPNIKVGTEGYTYVLRNYYKLQKTPFTAVYNKKGLLAFFYKNETPVDEMLSRLKKL